MFTRTKVLELTIAAVLILTLEPDATSGYAVGEPVEPQAKPAAAPLEPLNALSDADSADTLLSGRSVPSASSAVQADAENVEFVGHVGGSTYAVAIKGDYAYIGVGPRLTILDVSNPAAPSVAGRTMPLPGVVKDVYVVENYAYVAADDAGLRVVDVSSPASPTEVGFYDTPGGALGVVVAASDPPGHTYAYVADD